MTKVALLFLLAVSLQGSNYRAGVARVKITPPLPFPMAGYAARTEPATSVTHDLWAKALALDDGEGGRVVIVTTDLIGYPPDLSNEIASRVREAHGLERAQLLLNASHTHYGPIVALREDTAAHVKEYRSKLAKDIAGVVGAALGNLAPARLSFSQSTVAFAANRREKTDTGYRIGVNPSGPVDHSVPVIGVYDGDGKARAVLFGYACHNTTTPPKISQIHGDYAGFAQLELERANPGSTAMFLMLCGADQNPNPRGSLELSEQYGKALASSVKQALAASGEDLGMPLKTAYQLIPLPFAPHTRETYEERLNSPDETVARHARRMLEAYDAGREIRKLDYAVQAVAFGKGLTVVAMSDEVVIDYALRAKREFGGGGPLVVAGYSNYGRLYLPSLRVLREGGYEAGGAMVWGQYPGPFDESVEETVFKGLAGVLRQVGRGEARSR
jgi:neutral ceramidase